MGKDVLIVYLTIYIFFNFINIVKVLKFYYEGAVFKFDCLKEKLATILFSL